MLVRLIYPKNWTNTFRQIPDGKSAVDDITFTTEKVDEADLAVIVNFTPYDLNMRAREVWLFHQEPGNYRYFGHWIKSYEGVDRVFGSWNGGGLDKKCKNKIFDTHAPIFWQGGGGYDFYKNLENPAKSLIISAITSSKTQFKGHRERLDFLYGLQKIFKDTDLAFEIKGQGICPFELKDDILIPSKYTLAIENTKEKGYFSEKITDAFLCNCMPFYFGAPDIFDYFPKNSLILLENLNPQYASEKIREAVLGNFYEKNFDALKEAKNLVLNKYNFFMNVAIKTAEYDISNKPFKKIHIRKNRQMKHPFLSELRAKLKSTQNKV